MKRYKQEIYFQGSFRLGTVVRPIAEDDEYDIDLVRQLAIEKEQTTHANLKKVVGDRLKARDDLAKILGPFRRCWILDYPAENQMWDLENVRLAVQRVTSGRRQKQSKPLSIHEISATAKWSGGRPRRASSAFWKMPPSLLWDHGHRGH